MKARPTKYPKTGTVIHQQLKIIRWDEVSQHWVGVWNASTTWRVSAYTKCEMQYVGDSCVPGVYGITAFVWEFNTDYVAQADMVIHVV